MRYSIRSQCSPVLVKVDYMNENIVLNDNFSAKRFADRFFRRFAGVHRFYVLCSDCEGRYRTPTRRYFEAFSATSALRAADLHLGPVPPCQEKERGASATSVILKTSQVTQRIRCPAGQQWLPEEGLRRLPSMLVMHLHECTYPLLSMLLRDGLDSSRPIV